MTPRRNACFTLVWRPLVAMLPSRHFRELTPMAEMKAAESDRMKHKELLAIAACVSPIYCCKFHLPFLHAHLPPQIFCTLRNVRGCGIWPNCKWLVKVCDPRIAALLGIA